VSRTSKLKRWRDRIAAACSELSRADRRGPAYMLYDVYAQHANVCVARRLRRLSAARRIARERLDEGGLPDTVLHIARYDDNGPYYETVEHVGMKRPKEETR
jgi:hypothetical protein